MLQRYFGRIGILAGSLLALWFLNQYLTAIHWDNSRGCQILIFAGINIILAVSLNLINGYTGQFSIGHAGFMAVGAYVSAALTTYLNMPFLLALIIGGLFASFLGVLVGLPALRLKGDYLAIATLGFGEIIRVILLNVDRIGKKIDLGGASGFTGIPQLTHFFWVYFFVIITVLVVINLIRSSHGRALVSIREDEMAAEMMGINTTFYKVTAFAIGAFFAGIAGGLFAHYLTTLHPNKFNFVLSIEVVVIVVLGGMGSTTGCIVAAIFLTWGIEYLRDLSGLIKTWVNREVDLRMVIYSAMLIFLMLARPQGLFGNRELSLRNLFKGKKEPVS